MRYIFETCTVFLIGFAACTTGQMSTAPVTPNQPTDNQKQADIPQLPLGPADMDAVVRRKPSADADKELRQFGQLEGSWLCLGSQRQPDGSWKPQAHESRWTWFYTLGGQAVQDVYITPPELGGGVGTNIRIYERATNSWLMVWTTTGVKAFDTYKAHLKGDTIEMLGQLPARKKAPAHQARITFHNITPTAFAWKYEGGKIGGDQFVEFSRLACRRDGPPATLATAKEKAAWASN